MEILLLIVVIVGFISNILITRFLLRQISEKIKFLSYGETQTSQEASSFDFKGMFKNGLPGSSTPHFDAPAKNQVDDDENDLEFNEQTFSNLPKDLKVEVEGGDTYIPYGREEKN